MLVQVALANFIFTVMKKIPSILILRHFENIFNSVVKKVGSAHMHLLLLFSILFNALKVVFIYTQTFLFLIIERCIMPQALMN